MLELLVIALLAVTAWLIGSAAIRDTENARLEREEQARLAGKFGLQEIYVSPVDRSFVGFDYRSGKIALGSGTYEAEYDLARVASVEIELNGATVVRTERNGAAPTEPIRSRSRLRSLKLKVALDDEPVLPIHTVTFLDWPNRNGLDPQHGMAREARSRLERMHGQLILGVRKIRGGA
jgi:hypothetical protein